jgi:hypothetical protein
MRVVFHSSKWGLLNGVSSDSASQPVPQEAQRFVEGIFVPPNGLPAWQEFPKTVPLAKAGGCRCDANSGLLQNCGGARHAPPVNYEGYTVNLVAT